MRSRLLLLYVLTVIAGACKAPEKDWEEELSKKETYYFISNVPETQKIGDFNLGMEVLLSRNFMPSGDKNRPLLSFVTLKELAKQDITGAFDLETLEIITSAKSYKPSFQISQAETEGKSLMQWMSSTGPELDPAKMVDVICEFKDKKTGKYFSLIARRQVIRVSY